MKTSRKLFLKKERIRVLATQSLRAAVGGDEFQSLFCGPYDDGMGNLPNNFAADWRRFFDGTVWTGGGSSEEWDGDGWGRGSGWYV